MKKINETYLNNLVSKLLNETLEEKADYLVSKIKKKEFREGEITGEHPTFGELNFASMSDEEIDKLMRKYVKSGLDEPKTKKSYKDEDEFDFEEMDEEYMSEKETCNECGGMMTEGECSECGYKMEGIYDESKPFGKEQSFDYVEEEMKEESEKEMENKQFCDYHLKNFGPEDPEFIKMGCKVPNEMKESLVGKQKKLDKNKNGKIDAEDFKMLRKQKKGGENVESSHKGKKKGFPDLSGDGKITRKDILMGRGVKLKESISLSENELVELIEKIVREQKAGMKTLGKPKGLTKYEQVHKADGKENQEYLKMVAKKMKDYLKDGSKGDYEMNPKHFPKGNGELGEMKKKAYKPSDSVKDFTDNLTAAGQENLVYDEIHPNEDWLEKNIEGSSETGNNPKWANAVETPVNKKRNQIRKDNLLGAIKKQAYHKSDQPIVYDKSGEEVDGRHSSLNFKKANKVMSQLESVEPKEEKKLNEEFDRMKNLITYDRKTQ